MRRKGGLFGKGKGGREWTQERENENVQGTLYAYMKVSQ
jgi:hypothetical protein